MASELLKNRALIQKLKEPEIESINFNLADSALDYSVESLEEEILPQPKPQELFDERDRLRIESLEQSLQESKPFLMDESIDFIEREEFDRGGMAKLVEYVESLPDGTVVTGKMIDDYIQKNNLKVNAMNFFTRRAPLIKGKTFDTSYQGSRLSELEKANIEKYGKERYDKLNTTQQYRVRRGENVGALAPEKTQKVKFKKAYDDAKKFYESQGVKFDDKIKERVRKSIAANEGKFIPPGKGAKVFKARTMKTVRDVFVNNPDADGEEIARAMFGDKKFNAASLIEKEAMIKDANRQVPKFVQLFSPGSKEIIKGFKDIKPDKLVDILESIEEKTNEFGFDGQNRRELQFAIADAERGLPERTTIESRKALLTKGKDVDEVVGVSATFKNAPGYIEATQVIDKKINALKGKQIDLDFNKAFTAALEGDYSKVEDFNIKSKAFQKKYKVDTPVIKIGKNLDPKDFVAGFENYSLGAQKNIKQIAKDKGIVIETKAQPIKLKTLTATDSKNIAKQLASFGFKCSAAEGGACDNPLNYLDDIKKQQAIAKGSGNAAANAVKRLSAGKTILREFIGPAALTFELAAAVPLGYLSYKAGLPPARIANQLTYGAFGDTETARLKKVAVKEGVDTKVIDRILNFREKSGALQTLAMQEGDFRGPDDEMLFPQQFEKGEEDFYKAVDTFRDEEGKISGDVFKKEKALTEKIEDIIAKQNAALAAEREAKIDLRGIGEYLTDGIMPEEQPILPVFDFQEPSTRMDFSEGSPKDPSRRTFLKFLAGIASLPIVGKFFKGAKSAKVVKLANTSTTMPEWFPAFVEKAFERGVVKKIDADIRSAELPELPGIEIIKHDDGRVFVEGKNEYGKRYEIEYEPPGYELIDEKTGKAVKKKGEFIAQEEVPVNVDPDGNADFDVEVLDDLDQILGPDTRAMEEFATGKPVKEMKSGEFSVGKAEADADVARDLDDYYED
jgi:hypothetical protein